MHQEDPFTTVLTALLNGPAPAPISRVTSAGLAFIDAHDYSAALNTLHAFAMRFSGGPHALTVFYVIDSALKQVQRQEEQEALVKAIANRLPTIWTAVTILLDVERTQRLQKLISSWEKNALLPSLNLPPPSTPAANAAPIVSPSPPAAAAAAAATVAPTPAPFTPPAAVHPPFRPHPHKPRPHIVPPAHHPHHHNFNDDDDDDGIEPFSGGGGGGVSHSTWNAIYAAIVDEQLEFGDKILLPSSALQELTRLSVKFPLLLQLRNPANNKRTYAGVREFSAPEGKCVLPQWILNNVKGTRRLHVRTVELPLCTYVKLRPLGNDFARVTDKKALLEALLRHFSALTLNHTLHLHGAHSYDFIVTELQPKDAVCIIDTTMEVEFEGLEQPPEAAVAEPAAKQEPQGWRQGSGDSWARENPSVIVKGCPNCGSKVPQDKWTLHEAVCYRQNFGCPKCGKKMKAVDKEHHMKEFHSPVECPACYASLEAFQLPKHSASECPCRSVACKYCSLSFEARGLVEHEDYCGSRTEACELCGKRITLAAAEKHKSECIAIIDS